MKKKTFAKNYRKTKPYGITYKNGYDVSDELSIVVNKAKERRKNKVTDKDYE